MEEMERDAAREREPTTDAGTATPPQTPKEIGGRNGPEPTRFGDWEKIGRCVDF